RVEGPDRVEFSELASKLCELFQRAPAKAKALACHYPVIIFDEHQDANTDQHRIATIMCSIGGSRIRIFGDPMQAIFDFGDKQLIDWDSVVSECFVSDNLVDPYRWQEVPQQTSTTCSVGGSKRKLG
ncbi:MAG: UvrD-helicase domain-containing protein, partial [Chloroflexi bacterium]|nr:UvrD-helicase domain-containing protein [Chloroflexota bacterium]